MSSIVKKSLTIDARDAKSGQEYLSPMGNVIKVLGQSGENTIVCARSQDGNYDENDSFLVPGDAVLNILISRKNSLFAHVPRVLTNHKETKEDRHKLKAAVGLVKKAAAIVKTGERKRLPIVIDRKCPMVEIDGKKYRKNYRIRLSKLRAQECQGANLKACTCRCGGLYHGKSHKVYFEAEDALFRKYQGLVPAAQIVSLAKRLAGKK